MHRRSLLAYAGLSLSFSLTGCSLVRSNQSKPAYDTEVYLVNSSSVQQTVQVTVTHRGSAGTVYDSSHTIAPDTEIETYDFRNAPTDGVETYYIKGILQKGDQEGAEAPTEDTKTAYENGEEAETGNRAEMEFTTVHCMSDPTIHITEEGDLQTSHTEC